MKIRFGKLLSVSFAFILLLLNDKLVNSANLPPVIFVPGDGGSQLEAKLNKPEIVHYICDRTTSDYFSLWLNVQLLVPIVIDCWIDNIKLVYDNVTRKTSNQPGVDIRVPGFGDTFTVEWLDPSELFPGAYFNSIADALVNAGYQRDLNIKGAPYDFRKGPNELNDYFDNLKQLVENTYARNGNTKVVFIVHSMGGPLSALFFRKMESSWKEKYIKAMISLSGAYAGSMKIVKIYAVGDDLGVYVLNQRKLREVQITFPSTAWLMPNPLFWKEDELLIQTGSKNFSLSNIKEFFEGINYLNGWEMVNDQKSYWDFEAPAVEIHCLYGYGRPTVKRLLYGSGTLADVPTFLYGDGDGTVNIRSLESCKYWSGKQKQNVYSKKFFNSEHNQILQQKDVLSYITSYLTAGQGYNNKTIVKANKILLNLNN